jgi:hypothetical protein
VVGNLIPATIGNWIGGAVCVATVYALAYGRPNLVITQRAEQLRAAWAGRWADRRRRGLPA